MTKLPRVSICVPIFKVEKCISKCAESLIQQTYKNIEFIFVNDCTPDNSMNILCEVIEKHPARSDSVKIINLPKNEGVAYARNLAVENATGEFIFWCDSDDWIEHETIETLVNEGQRTNADIISCNFCIHKNHGEIKIHNTSSEDPLIHIIKRNHNYRLWGRLIKRSLYKDHGIRSIAGLNVAEELPTMPKLLYFAEKHHYVDKALYHYNRCNVNSLGFQTSDSDWYRQLLENYDLFYRFFIGLNDSRFTDIIKKGKTDFLFLYMGACVSNSQKRGFQLLKQELIKHEESNPEFKYHDFKHFLKRNYTVYHFLKHFSHH